MNESSKKQRRQYTGEFKREAVELAKTSGRSLAALERELGMSAGLLKQWVRQAREAEGEAFRGQGNRRASEEALRQLRHENMVLRQEREILKKALAIFS